MKEIFIFSLLVGVSLSQQSRRYSRRRQTAFHTRNPSPIFDPTDFNDSHFVDPIFRNRQISNVPGFHPPTRKVNSNGGSYLQLVKRKWLSSANRVRKVGPLPTLPPVPTNRRTKYVSAIKTPSYTPSPLDVLPKRRPSYLPTVRGVNVNNNPFQSHTPVVDSSQKPKYIPNHVDKPKTGGIQNPLFTGDNYVSNKDNSISQKDNRIKTRKNTNQDIHHINPILGTVPVLQEAYDGSVQKEIIHPVHKLKGPTDSIIHSVQPILTSSSIGDVIAKVKPNSYPIDINSGQIAHVNSPQDSSYQKGSIADTVSPKFTDIVAPVENGYIEPIATKHVNPPSEIYTGTFLPDTNIKADKTPISANYEDPMVSTASDVLPPVLTKDSNYVSGIPNNFPDGHFVDSASSVPDVHNQAVVKNKYVDPVLIVPGASPLGIKKTSNYDNIGQGKNVPTKDSNYADPVVTVPESVVLAVSKGSTYDKTEKTVDSNYVPDVHTSVAADSVDPVEHVHNIHNPVVTENSNYVNNGNSEAVPPVDSNYVDPILTVPDVHTTVAADSGYVDPVEHVHDVQTPVVTKNSNYVNNGNSEAIPPVDSNYVDPILIVPDVHTSVAVDSGYVDPVIPVHDIQTPVVTKNPNYVNNGNSEAIPPVDSNYVDPILTVPDVHIPVAVDSGYVDPVVPVHDVQTPVIIENSNYENNGNSEVVPHSDSNYVDPILTVPDVNIPVAADSGYVDPVVPVHDVQNPVVTKNSNYESNGNSKVVDTFIMAVPNIDFAPPVESAYDGTSTNNPANELGNLDARSLPGPTDIGILQDLGLPSKVFPTFDQHSIITSNNMPDSEITDHNHVATSGNKKVAIHDPLAPVSNKGHNKAVNPKQVIPIVEEPFAENPWGPTAIDPVDHSIDAGIPHPPVGAVVKAIQTSTSGKENVKEKPIVKTAAIPEPKWKGGFLSETPKQHNHNNHENVRKAKPTVAPVDISVHIDPFNEHTAIDTFPTLNGASISEPGFLLPDLAPSSLEPGFSFTDSVGDATFPQEWSPEALGISPFDNPEAFNSHFDQHFPFPSVTSTTNKPPLPRHKTTVQKDNLSLRNEPINNVVPIVDKPAISRPTASNIQDAISRIGDRVRGATGAFDPRWDNPLVPSNRTGTYVDPKPLPPVDPSIGNPGSVQRLFEGQNSVNSAVTNTLNSVSSRTLDLAEERLRRRQQQQQRGYPSKYHALRAFEG